MADTSGCYPGNARMGELLMIVVKIELWRFGFEDLKEEIGRMYIWNKGGSKEHGDYGVAVMKKGQFEEAKFREDYKAEKPKFWARKGEVLDYPRLSYNVWRLICRALKSTFPEEGRWLRSKNAEGTKVDGQGERPEGADLS